MRRKKILNWNIRNEGRSLLLLLDYAPGDENEQEGKA
jgi:hypothetical protein